MQELPGERPQSPKCSIIIPVFNKWFYTSICLMSLARTLVKRSVFEIIIVDNASTDETAAQLRALASPYRVVTNTKNLGFARACNQGASVATGEFLLFLNNDTVPTEGWLDAMLRVADEYRDAGIVGSKLLYPDGSIQHAGVAISDELIPMHMYCLFPADYAEAALDREYQAVTGACLLIRRALFEEIGGFDQRYLNSYEDIDLCCRVRRRGLKVMYAANSVLYHFESVSSGRHERDEANQRLFLSRWSGFVKADQRERYLAAGFLDVPQVPGLTVPELWAQLSDQRRIATTLQESLSLVVKSAQRAGTPQNGPSVRPTVSGQVCEPVATGAAWAHLPEAIEMGSSVTVRLVIANLADSAWKASDGWFATYQWLTEQGIPARPEERLPIATDVWSGQTISLDVAVTAPGQPGTYQVKWGLARQRKPSSRDSSVWLATQKTLVTRRYAVEYSAHVPKVMAAGGQAKALVGMRNVGSRIWLPNAGFSLSYHWYDASGCAVVEWDGPRAAVAERVPFGESVAVTIPVTAPKLAGDYVLAFDMVEEYVAWFSHAGVSQHMVQVRVELGPEKVARAATGDGSMGPRGSDPEICPGSTLPEEFVTLLRAKDKQIGELMMKAESLQSLRIQVSQQTGEVKRPSQRPSTARERIKQLEDEVRELRDLVHAFRQGRVMRALESMHALRRRLHL